MSETAASTKQPRTWWVQAALFYGVLAPLLFSIGYPLLSTIHLSWLAVAIVLGALFSWLRWLAIVPVLIFWLVVPDLYFLDLTLWQWGSIAAGAAFLFLIFRVHFSRLSAVFAAMFSLVTAISTLSDCHCLPQFQRGDGEETGTGTHAEQPPANNRPPIVHILLDGQSSLENLTADGETAASFASAKLMSRVLEQRDFHVVPLSFSPQIWTHLSMAALLNPRVRNWHELSDRDTSGEFEWRFNQLTHFTRMRDMGYALFVTQPDYADYCSAPEFTGHCRTYRARAADFVLNKDFDLEAQLRIAGGLLERSTRARSTNYREAVYRPKNARWEYWVREELRPWVGSLGAMDVLRQFEAEVTALRPGEYHLLHLLVPHAPYAWGSDCELIDPKNWLNSRERQDARGEAERTEHRAQYLKQVNCAWKNLDQMLETLQTQHPEAIVILHSDHGSRVAAGRYKNWKIEDYDDPRDWSDFHATLFATHNVVLPENNEEEPQPETIEKSLTRVIQAVADQLQPEER